MGEPLLADTLGFLQRAAFAGNSASLVEELDLFRSSGAAFPLHLAWVLGGHAENQNDEHVQSLPSELVADAASPAVRQMAGILLKQVVKNAPSIESVEDDILHGLSCEERSVRDAAAGTISAVIKGESLDIWPSLPGRIQLMSEAGQDGYALGAARCIALVSEDLAHELVRPEYQHFQESLFAALSQLVSHGLDEVRLNCFRAVAFIMAAVVNFVGQDDGDDDGMDCGDIPEAPVVHQQNIELLASLITPHFQACFVVPQDASQPLPSLVADMNVAVLDCSLAMMSSWDQLLQVLPDMLPGILEMVARGSCGDDGYARVAGAAIQLLAELLQAVELGAGDILLPHTDALLHALLSALEYDQFTASFFELGANANQVDLEPNVRILTGRVDEDAAAQSLLDAAEADDLGSGGGGNDNGGDGGEVDEESALRSDVRWCLGLLTAEAMAPAVLQALGGFADILNGPPNARPDGQNAPFCITWQRHEAALSFIAEVCDELFEQLPPAAIQFIVQSCIDSQRSPISLVRCAGVRCAQRLLSGCFTGIANVDDGVADALQQALNSSDHCQLIEGTLGFACGAIEDCNKDVQATAIHAVTELLQTAFTVAAAAMAETGAGEEEDDGFVDADVPSLVPADFIQNLWMNVIPRLLQFQLKSRVCMYELVTCLAAHDSKHGTLTDVAPSVFGLLLDHWETLPPFGYEGAAIMNCLCDVIDEVGAEVLEQVANRIAGRCEFLCGEAVAVLGSNSSAHAAAEDIAALALDTLSAICDRLPQFATQIPQQLLHNTCTLLESASNQLQRAGFGLLGDYAAAASDPSTLLETSTSVVRLAVAAMDRFVVDRVPPRVRSNVVYALAQAIGNKALPHLSNIASTEDFFGLLDNHLMPIMQESYRVTKIHLRNILYCAGLIAAAFTDSELLTCGHVEVIIATASRNVDEIDDLRERCDVLHCVSQLLGTGQAQELGNNEDAMTGILKLAISVPTSQKLLARERESNPEKAPTDDEIGALVNAFMPAVQLVAQVVPRRVLTSKQQKALHRAYGITLA